MVNLQNFEKERILIISDCFEANIFDCIQNGQSNLYICRGSESKAHGKKTGLESHRPGYKF